MKQISLIATAVAAMIVLVVLGVTWNQANQERVSLSTDLRYRTNLLADSLKESVEPTYTSSSADSLQKLVDKFANREHIVGLAVYDNKSKKLAASTDLSGEVVDNQPLVTKAMDSDQSLGNFVRSEGRNLYVFAEPLHYNDRVVGSFIVISNASYIDETISQIWQKNISRSLLQVLLFLLIVSVFVWWLIWTPLKSIVESVKSARSGSSSQAIQGFRSNTFFGPLVKEIAKITTSLSEARRSASEEARMRLEKIDTPWTAERLKEFVKAYLKDRKFFVVSNREPYVHHKIKNKIEYTVPAHGMVTAVESVMAACGGLWIAHGSGDADKETVDQNDMINVPPEEPKYTLKRIWLSEKEVQGHYVGFSNEALFPLCLMSHTRPIFRKEDWLIYRKVNGKFAQALLREIKNVSQPIVLVQDLQFALVPGIIKKSRPDAQVGLFWHHPWPSAEQFSICPWRKEIIEGMLGADVIGFHIQQHCNNFLETVGKEVESIIDFEKFSVTRAGHTSIIRPFPVSVAFTDSLANPEKDSAMSDAVDQLGAKTEFFGLGVDRLDYTKGILERFRGVERFIESHPEYKNKFKFIQIAAPSREKAQKYKEYGEQVAAEAKRINEKLGTSDWQPIVYEKKHYSHAALDPFYRQANFCLVTSLHDGMNLVSKEFAASRDDEQGVLILSQFTGAARELTGALIVNPYNIEEIAEAIHKALVMPVVEQHGRMKEMRNRIKSYNVYRWAAEFIKAVANIG